MAVNNYAPAEYGGYVSGVEGGGGGGGNSIPSVMIDIIDDNGTYYLDKTWNELYELWTQGVLMYTKYTEESSYGTSTDMKYRMNMIYELSSYVDSETPSNNFYQVTFMYGDYSYYCLEPTDKPQRS